MKGRTTFVAVLLLVGAAAWADTYISDTWRKVVNDLILDGVGLRIEEGTGANYKKLVAPGGGFTGDHTCTLEDDASFIPDSCVGDGVDGGGGGAGEANTASNLGGGLANWSAKVGVDLQFNSFSSADFDLAANLITVDAAKWLTIAAAAAAYQPLATDLTNLVNNCVVDNDSTPIPDSCVGDGVDDSGGGGGGNSVETTISLSGGSGYFSATVGSQTWVAAGSEIVCTPFGTTADSLTPEAISVANITVTASDKVAGTSFNINVYNPYGLEGTLRVHCIGV